MGLFWMGWKGLGSKMGIWFGIYDNTCLVICYMMGDLDGIGKPMLWLIAATGVFVLRYLLLASEGRLLPRYTYSLGVRRGGWRCWDLWILGMFVHWGVLTDRCLLLVLGFMG
jgi:hypothetical protein